MSVTSALRRFSTRSTDFSMHPSSFENMLKCYEKYGASLLDDTKDEKLLVLDIGGADVNGSYRPIFSDPRITYRSVDLKGSGADILLSDPYQIPLPDKSADIVISGQMLEHCEFFWLTFAEMVRVLKPHGYIFLIAPSAGPLHRHPVDCYRFYPDAFPALAKYVACDVIETWHDHRGPWKDLVGVFAHKSIPDSPNRKTWARWPQESTKPDPSAWTGPAEAESIFGDVSYLDILGTLHNELKPALYFESGVRNGDSLSLANREAIGVDPFPKLANALNDLTSIYATTTDRFFDETADSVIHTPINLAFIDGMHLFEFALRDFMNIERYCNVDSVIVFDDIFPSHPLQASRRRQTRSWAGDVWKIQECLLQNRPDLILIPIDASPAGLLLATNLDPMNRTLTELYNPIVRHYQNKIDLPAEILSRENAVLATDSRLSSLFDTLKELRSRNSPETEARSALQSWKERYYSIAHHSPIGAAELE